jgi:hypothetical protein
MKSIKTPWLLLFCMAVLPSGAPAQESPTLLLDRELNQSPALLVVGSGHFTNPGRDAANIVMDDVLTEARQAEIAAVANQLAAFHPTHVAVEWPQSDQATLDTRYREYREDSYQLTAREAEQLGLRVAALAGLEQVHAVDWNGLPPGEQANYDWYAYANAHGDESLIAALTDPDNIPFSAPGDLHIGAWLLALNSAEALGQAHRWYFDIAALGAGEERPGANWVGHWYARNLRIFTNLVQLTERPEDRVLVIYGAGHAYLLRQFAQESQAFRLMDVDEILNFPE